MASMSESGRIVSTGLEAAHARRLRRLRWLGRLLDSRFRVPGTPWKVGIDPLLGLLPGVGDVASLALSGYIIWEARQMGVSRVRLARMVGNVALDALAGTVPVVGDLFDFAYKANLRNLRLMGIDLDEDDQPEQAVASRPRHP